MNQQLNLQQQVTSRINIVCIALQLHGLTPGSIWRASWRSWALSAGVVRGLSCASLNLWLRSSIKTESWRSFSSDGREAWEVRSWDVISAWKQQIGQMGSYTQSWALAMNSQMRGNRVCVRIWWLWRTFLWLGDYSKATRPWLAGNWDCKKHLYSSASIFSL